MSQSELQSAEGPPIADVGCVNLLMAALRY